MTKIRCGKDIGIDLDRVVAWRRFAGSTQEDEIIRLFVTGVFDSGFDIPRDYVGCQAFTYLHKLLLDQFAIDLAGENDLPCVEEDDIDYDLVDELEDLPY